MTAPLMSTQGRDRIRVRARVMGGQVGDARRCTQRDLLTEVCILTKLQGVG